VGADDGLLAIDLNADGIINDSGELFGNQTGFSNGFLALSAYDSNEDGVITQEDSVWDDLCVWIDDNINGFSEADELHTMNDLLITEIDLGYSDVSYTISGNEILQESMFTINGNAHDIVDAWFKYSDSNTVYSQSYDLDERAFSLPTMRGYGNIPNLHAAISLDNDDQDPDSLISLVTDLSELSFANLFDDTTDVLDESPPSCTSGQAQPA
jgi:hypothetical protein